MPELIEAIRQAVRSGAVPGPDLRLALAQSEDLALLLAAGQALRELSDPAEQLTHRRVGILSVCPPGDLEPLLRACLVGAGVWPELIVIPPQAFAPTLAAGGARLGADLLFCLLDENFFLPPAPEPAPAGYAHTRYDDTRYDDTRFEDTRYEDTHDDPTADPTAPSALWPWLAERLAMLRTLLGTALRAGDAVVVLHTVPLPRALRDAVLGARARAALTSLWHRLNASLLALADDHPRVRVIDLVGLLAETPVAARADVGQGADPAQGADPGQYSPGALLLLAQEVRRVVQAGAGLSRQVLAIDLASPLWGDATGELRRTVARLRDQGVRLLLVGGDVGGDVGGYASGDGDAVGPVRELPLPRLGAAERLRRAAGVLGLPLDAFVYLDDSDVERGAVAAELPEVAVIEAGGPPDRLARLLLQHGWFDQQ
ncbi:hypothetical protein [Kitasatospora kifunensis]|uniref:Uncharacterized protein n=1 Tax=Kitasatospora kifunensis TaxID=58351 RepID=A0A7W7VVD0_KITKI|nr:hypothetical protein [Kitasatospora kifunensis]MBB4924252.1 hypothetical protein [Kitasatospora kifunensis]